MPRRNAAGTVGEGDHLARRIGYEREQRGWSYAGLAKRMTDAGCPIDQSAVFKIEKGEPGKPRRRITIEEAVAFGRVFGVPLENLLLPPEIVTSARAVELVTAMEAALLDISTAAQRHLEAQVALNEYLVKNPEAAPAIDVYLATLAPDATSVTGGVTAELQRQWQYTKEQLWQASEDGPTEATGPATETRRTKSTRATSAARSTPSSGSTKSRRQ